MTLRADSPSLPASTSASRSPRFALALQRLRHAALVDSINHLLLVGFYLVNIGFVSLALRYGTKPTDLVGAKSPTAGQGTANNADPATMRPY